MKIIYVAGPFRAKTAFEIAENTREAERLGLEVSKLGAMPMIPHANTALFHDQGDERFWLDGTLELMRRCDAVIFTSRWKESEGARGERDDAQTRGLPQFFSVDELRQWLEREIPVAPAPPLPRRGDEDLREATQNPIFLLQGRRLVVTDHDRCEWDEAYGCFIDDDESMLTDEQVVERGLAHWEWDTYTVAFTRAEGEAWAKANAHNGPFRVYSVPTMGDLRTILRRLTDYEGGYEPGGGR